MGITQQSLNRLSPYLKPKIKILELGAQNMYDNTHYGMIAKHYFESMGIYHRSLDIIEHQGAECLDLRDDLEFEPIYDIVSNFGTCEHIDGSIYQAFKNIHEACKIGGVMVHENPKTDNWPGHGQHYFTKEFYQLLAKDCHYDIFDLTEEAAMGNLKDGWNVCCVLYKTSDKFCTEEQFNQIYKNGIFAK